MKIEQKPCPPPVEKTVLANMGLAVFAATQAAKQFPHLPSRVLELDDFIQDAFEALVNAALTYDEVRGQFSTYAIACMRRAIQISINTLGYPLTVPKNFFNLTKPFREARARLQQTLGREPTAEEIAASLGRSVTVVSKAEEAYQRLQFPLSLEDPPEGKEKGGQDPLFNWLADGGGCLSEVGDDQLPQLKGRLRELVAVFGLTPLEVLVFNSRFGIVDDDGEKGLDQIATMLRITKKSAREALRRALKKLEKLANPQLLLDAETFRQEMERLVKSDGDIVIQALRESFQHGRSTAEFAALLKSRLTPKQYQVVAYLYGPDPKIQQEIAGLFFITPQRVSQLHQQALKKLREGMGGLEGR